MKNIVPVHRAAIQVGRQSPYDFIDATTDDNDNIYCFFSNEDNIYIHVFDKFTWVEWPAWPGLEIKAISADPGTCLVILKNGNVVEASENGAALIGDLGETVLAAKWSPDGEVVCIVTGSKVLLFSRTLDPVGEYEPSAQDLSHSRHVNVGWGKKETQFEGRGAKKQRDPTMPEKVDSGVLCENDDSRISISWRGDGEYLAVSSIESNRRVIRVYARDGSFDSVSEPVDYLGSLVAWRPSGAVIASVQENPPQVVFFERNGLRRYGFPLCPNEKVNGLAWNADSQCLAVQYAEKVEIYTTKNYHWYRKQTILSHTNSPHQITNVRFHLDRPRTLLVTWRDVIETHTFVYAPSIGPTHQEGNGSVAVVDGDSILVTPLGKVNIPPPMSFAKLEVPRPVHVAIGSDNETFAVATNQCVYVARGGDRQPRLDENQVQVRGTPRQVSYTTLDELVVLSDDNNQSILTFNEMEVKAEGSVFLLKQDHYLVTDGTIYTLYGQRIGSLGRPCVDFCVTENSIFGLSDKNILLGDDGKVLAHGITSMLLTENHLAVTTPTLLKFVHLSNNEIPHDSSDSEQCREIERGSLLVTAVSSKMSVILQAPRGNLETIFPRIFVLGKVREAVRAQDYMAAFMACRVHRIDLNVLYDLAPKQFEDNILLVVEQLKTPERLDLFIGSLKDEDVTETKYKDTLESHAVPDPEFMGVKPGKINRVCALLRQHMPSKQNILTSYACQSPPDLQGALNAASHDDEEALRHLVFLTDADLLYRTALGMYNLHLALTVAQLAQKDPKEYLPFLRAREAEPLHRRMFSIDNYVKKYDKALKSLISEPMAEDQEVYDYVERYNLHSLALELVPAGSEREKAILTLQAEAWLSAAKYHDAGTIFESLGQPDKAVSAYILAGDWRRVLTLDPGQALEMAHSLTESKQFGDAGDIYAYHLDPVRYADAVESYCKGYRFDDAYLTVNRSDEHARLLELADSGLMDCFGVIRELISDCAGQITSQVRRLRQLRESRDKDSLGYTMASMDIADDVSVAGTETTTGSYVTRYTDKTGGTAQTGASRRTQKNKRREERKRARGKKGTVYEEEYLVSSIGRLVERLVQNRPDAKKLVDALLRRAMRVYATDLRTSFSGVVNQLAEVIGEVYDVSEASLVRYDEHGAAFNAPKPVAPELPELFD